MPLANPKLKSVFSIQIDTQNYVSDITKFRLYSEDLDAERITFSRYMNGTAVKWKLGITAVFDGGTAGSLHDYLWTHSGAEADFLIRPFQEFDPLTKRGYAGVMRIPKKPPIIIEAGRKSTYEYEFEVIGEPVRTDTPSGFLTAGYYDTY